MNKTIASSIVIAFAALAGGQAMAANVDPTTGVDYDALRAAMSAPVTVSRAQVKADAVSYRAAHKADVIDATTGVNFSEVQNLRKLASGKTRAQVREELMESRRNAPARSIWETIVI